MTRWHTDKPVSAIPEIRPFKPIGEIQMPIASRAGEGAFSIARDFYRNRLRRWAKTHPRSTDESDDDRR